MTATRTHTHPTGTVVAGRYRVESLLGEGGFASVYLDRHVELDTAVALKCMHPQHLTRDDLQGRFRAEARTAATLESRHTVRVRDFGFDDAGAPFMVMDLVKGQTLEDVLATHGPLEASVVGRIALGVLASLQEAADHGVVHRDIKPQNIFLAHDKETGGLVARVGDFGIAKLLGAGEQNATRTVDGVLCTPQYAAPELLHRNAVPASDLYALGHVLIELLDGTAPYASDNAIVSAAQHLSPDPVPLGPRSAASAIAGVLRRATAKAVEQRYTSAAQMAAAIDAALGRARLPTGVAVAPDGLGAASAPGAARSPMPTGRNAFFGSPVSTPAQGESAPGAGSGRVEPGAVSSATTGDAITSPIAAGAATRVAKVAAAAGTPHRSPGSGKRAALAAVLLGGVLLLAVALLLLVVVPRGTTAPAVMAPEPAPVPLGDPGGAQAAPLPTAPSGAAAPGGSPAEVEGAAQTAPPADPDAGALPLPSAIAAPAEPEGPGPTERAPETAPAPIAAPEPAPTRRPATDSTTSRPRDASPASSTRPRPAEAAPNRAPEGTPTRPVETTVDRAADPAPTSGSRIRVPRPVETIQQPTEP